MHRHSLLSARWFWHLGAVLAAGLGVGVAGEVYGADAFHRYRVERGDTLIGLGQRWLVNPLAWPEIARANQLRDNNRIAVGQELRIPLHLLAVESMAARVIAFSGDVQVKTGATVAAATVGSVVPEGAEVSTGQGNVTVQLVDGTVLRLRSSSRLKIEESHRVTKAGIVRSGVMLQQGQVEADVQPAKGGQPGFRVSTQQGVLGVRGTQFRVSADTDSRTTRGEVLQGAVVASGAPAYPSQQVNAGFGVAVDSTGRVPLPVPLLAAPVVTQLAPLHESLVVRFALTPMAGAVAHRGQVARDAQFDHVIADQMTSTNELSIAGLEDGDYVLRLRALDAAGLQGFNAEHRFRLKARPEAPMQRAPAPRARLQGDRVELVWASNPEARSYRLQIASVADFSALVRDMPGQGGAPVAVSGLNPGSYFWRVASERGPGDQGPFSAVQQFELVPIPPPPPAPTVPAPARVGVDDQAMSLSWAAEAGQSFEVQVARDSAFTQLVVRRVIQASSLVLELEEPGRHYVRFRQRLADGSYGPFSAVQFFEVPNCVRMGGRCLRSNGHPVLIGP